MASLGQLLFTRRQSQGLSLAKLSEEMGGAPSESFLWRIESDVSSPTASMAIKLAHGVRLPEDLLLNAAGHATAEQQRVALERLADIVGEPAPVAVSFDVLDQFTGQPTREKVTHVLRRRREGFVVRLSGQPNAMFNGECIVDTQQPPDDGQGVVFEKDDSPGLLKAGVFHPDRIEQNGSAITEGYRVLGSIIRVVKQTSWE